MQCRKNENDFFSVEQPILVIKVYQGIQRKVPGLIHAARTGTATFLGREGKHNNRSSQSSQVVETYNTKSNRLLKGTYNLSTPSFA